MALDSSFVGRRYPPEGTYQVGRAKITEFADAIGDTSALCRDVSAAQDAGYPDVIAPPTFLTIVNLRAIETIIGDPELGVDYRRMVHGRQHFRLERAVHAGDELSITTHIDEIYSRAGSDFVTVRAEITDTADALVAVCTAQLVVRGS